MEGTLSPLESPSNIEVRKKFVQDLNGTTLEEVMLFSLHLPLLTFFPILIELCVLSKLKTNVYKLISVDCYSSVIVFLVEFFTVVIPLVMILTVLSEIAHLTILCVIAIIFLRITYSVSSPDDYVRYWKFSQSKTSVFLEDVDLFRGKQPFITYFRSLSFLATAISILGVDLHVYPRRFAKTESFGVSLMDLGVGLFVVSSALVKTNKPIVGSLLNALLESAVFLGLGIIRYFCIQQIDYQTHVTEYGVHWNFFITLGLMKPISYFIQLISGNRNMICGLFLLIIDQYFISSFLESYVLGNKPRDYWIDANREGLASLTGYICIYLFGCAIANVIKSKEDRGTKNKVKTVGVLILLSIIFFCTTYSCDKYYIRASRRLANLPYVLWVVTVTLAVLTISIVVELLLTYFLPIQPRFKSHLYYVMTPAILVSVNYNGLLFFLITNILTGFLNIYVDLYSLNSFSSVMILITYMMVSCAVVFGLYLVNIQIRPKMKFDRLIR